MISDSELIGKYNKQAAANNSIEQTGFSSMAVNGIEVTGGTNLVSQETQITRRDKKKIASTVLTSEVIFLFMKDEDVTVNSVTKTVTRLYVGGDRDEPEQIYELEDGYTFFGQPTINKTDAGVEEYIVNFVLKGVIYKFCTVQGGVLSELKYLPTGAAASGGLADVFSFNHGFFNSISVLNYGTGYGAPRYSDAAGLYMTVTYNTPTFWGSARESPIGSMSKTYRLSTDPEATYTTLHPFGGTIRVNGSVIDGLLFYNQGAITSQIYSVEGESQGSSQPFDINYNPFADITGGSGWYLYTDYIDLVDGEAVPSREYVLVSPDLDKHVGLVPYIDGTIDLFVDNEVAATYNFESSTRTIAFISYPFRVGNISFEVAPDVCSIEDSISNYQGYFIDKNYSAASQFYCTIYTLVAGVFSPATGQILPIGGIIGQYTPDNIGLETATIENIPFPPGSNFGSTLLIDRTVFWLPEKNYILQTLSSTQRPESGQTIQALPPSAFRIVDCREGILKPYLNDKAIRVTFNKALIGGDNGNYATPTTVPEVVECIGLSPIRTNPDRRYYASPPTEGGAAEDLVTDISFTGQFYVGAFFERLVYQADYVLFDEFGNSRTFFNQSGSGNQRNMEPDEVISKIELVGRYSTQKTQDFRSFKVRRFSVNPLEDTQADQLTPPNQIITIESDERYDPPTPPTIYSFEVIPSVSININQDTPAIRTPLLTGKDSASALYHIFTFDYNTYIGLTSPTFITSEDPPVTFGTNAFKTPTDLFPLLANGDADPRNNKTIFSFRQPNLIDNIIYSVTTPADPTTIDTTVDVITTTIESDIDFSVQKIDFIEIPEDFKPFIIDSSAFLG